jgi:hypothetical protein
MAIVAPPPDDRPAVTAFCEITITVGMCDHGLLTDRALRQIRHDLHGIDPQGRVVVHLGPMREPDQELCRTLARLECEVLFGGNFRVASAAARMLNKLRTEKT